MASLMSVLRAPTMSAASERVLTVFGGLKVMAHRVMYNLEAIEE